MAVLEDIGSWSLFETGLQSFHNKMGWTAFSADEALAMEVSCASRASRNKEAAILRKRSKSGQKHAIWTQYVCGKHSSVDKLWLCKQEGSRNDRCPKTRVGKKGFDKKIHSARFACQHFERATSKKTFQPYSRFAENFGQKTAPNTRMQPCMRIELCAKESLAVSNLWYPPPFGQEQSWSTPHLDKHPPKRNSKQFRKQREEMTSLIVNGQSLRVSPHLVYKVRCGRTLPWGMD